MAFLELMRRLHLPWPGATVAREQAVERNAEAVAAQEKTGTPQRPTNEPVLKQPEKNAVALDIPTREKLSTEIVYASSLNFLPYVSALTEETSEIRAAYRVMLREPMVKAALQTKIASIAALDYAVNPADPESEREKEIAEFVKAAIGYVKGGMPKIIETLCFALVDGFAVAEKTYRVQPRGKWRNKIVLNGVKGKDINRLRITADEFWNVKSVVSYFKSVNESFDPSEFIIFTHQPVFEHPTGNSDLRAAYRAYVIKDACWRLRARYLEKFGAPIVVGKYDPSKAEDKRALENALELTRSMSWMALPEDVQVEVMSISSSATSDFQSAIADLDREITTSIAGAFLQSVEGATTGARATGEVHERTANALRWLLSQNIAAVLNEQLVKEIVDMNYALREDEDYPTLVLEPVVQADLQQAVTVDQGLANLGLELSRQELYKFYGRTPPMDADDKIGKPQGPAPGGFPGMPGGGGGGGGGLPFDEHRGRNGNGNGNGGPAVSTVTQDLSPPPTDELEDYAEEVRKKASRFRRAARLRGPGKVVKSR